MWILSWGVWSVFFVIFGRRVVFSGGFYLRGRVLFFYGGDSLRLVGLRVLVFFVL